MGNIIHQQDDSSMGCGFLEGYRSVTHLLLWNLSNLIGVEGLRAELLFACIAFLERGSLCDDCCIGLVRLKP